MTSESFNHPPPPQAAGNCAASPFRSTQKSQDKTISKLTKVCTHQNKLTKKGAEPIGIGLQNYAPLTLPLGARLKVREYSEPGC